MFQYSWFSYFQFKSHRTDHHLDRCLIFDNIQDTNKTDCRLLAFLCRSSLDMLLEIDIEKTISIGGLCKVRVYSDTALCITFGTIDLKTQHLRVSLR